MDKNKVSEIIDMTESVLGLKKGSISWGITSKRLDGSMYICVWIKKEQHEFLNVMTMVGDDFIDTVDMVNNVISKKERISERLFTVLSVYGMVNLVKNISDKKVKMIYVADFDAEDSMGPMMSFDNLCLN